MMLSTFFTSTHKRMFISLLLIGSIVLGCIIYLQNPNFGKSPSGNRLERIKQSPNYKDGKFQNLTLTPDLTEGYTTFDILLEIIFRRNPRQSPSLEIPSEKTDLKNIPADENILVWFGHSSYFLQIDGRKFLIDPVFGGAASPLPFGFKAFKGSDQFVPEDLPEIDYLIITHDHYDHLDHSTMKAILPKVNKVICGLGVGEHLELWGYLLENIIEEDWNQHIILENGFEINTTPTRHFSGRSFKRNNTLWMSYVLQTPTQKIYIGGDSGYDSHFSKIGHKFGPFDLAILENGQYDVKWKYIHLLPEEVLKAATELKAKRLFPVHSSKFAMSNHDWDEPLKLILLNNEKVKIPLITPLIGEKVLLSDTVRQYRSWWN